MNPNDFEGVVAVSAEQSADLANLEAMAGAGQVQAVEQGQAAPEVPDLAMELEDGATMLLSVFGPVFPSVEKIYTPEVKKTGAGVLAALMNKYGLLQGGLMGRYAEEVAAVLVLGPLAVATYKAVQADIAARQAANPAKPAEVSFSAPVMSDQMPGAKTVSVGVPA